MASLSPAYSVPLLHFATSYDALSWSEDDRIALTSNDIIYVFTLTGMSSSPPRGTLPASVTMVHIPKVSPHTKIDPSPSPLKAPAPSKIPTEQNDLSVFLDPLLNSTDTSSDSFINAKWSPVGCGPNGRCLLTCLTRYSKLYIFAPPSLFDLKWKMVCDVSCVYNALLLLKDYNIERMVDMEIEQISAHQPTGCPPVSSDNITSTNVLSDRGSHSDPSATPNRTSSDPSATPNRTSSGPSATPKEISSKYYQEAEQFQRKKYSQVITAFDWFPISMVTSSGEKCLLLSVAVRAGYVLLWSFVFKSGGSDDPKLITTIKLSCDTHWPNMMKWDSFKWGHTLTIGYTNGKVDCLYWEPTESLTPTWFMSPHPLTTLWSHEDEIVVDLLVWTDKSRDQLTGKYCIFAKGSHILIVPVTFSPLLVLKQYIFISGVHQSIITGLSLLNDNSVITCSRDGTLQTVPVPVSENIQSCDNLVTNDGCHAIDKSSTAVPMSLSTKCQCSFHGIVSSPNSLFVVLSLNFISLNKLKHPSEIQLLPLTPQDHTFLETSRGSWDIYEYLKLAPPDLVKDLATHDTLYNKTIRRFLRKLTSAFDDGSSFYQFPENTVDMQILSSHAKETLNKFASFKSGSSNSKELSHLCIVSLRNLSLLLSGEFENEEFIDYVQGLHVSLGTAEYCPICNEGITYTCQTSDSCSQGHCWDRCVLTQCLVSQPHLGVQCSICGRHALSISHVKEGSWLSWLLSNNIQCPLCSGYFESFI